MNLWTSLEPASATVDPGSSAHVRLRVRNTGDVVDEYRFEPVGHLAPWTTVEPQVLRLYPGTTGTVELTFAPPRTPDATAGPNPYAVRITPTEHPDAVTVPEGNLTITPFTEVRAELVPPTVKGRFRGRPKLAVDNLGNTKVTASLSGSDNGDQLSYELRPAYVQIDPGRAAFVDATLKPQALIWLGSAVNRSFTLALRRPKAEPAEVRGTFVQRGFLPHWLATVLATVLTLAIAFLLIWIAYKPQVRTQATAQTEAGNALAPEASSEPTREAPSEPPAPVSPTATQPSPDTQGGGGGGGGKKKEEEKKEEVERTAATAVKEVNARSEGRHICYRVYVAGQGWQEPVCDGAVAGTAGQGRPIKAINFAVSGTEGIDGNGAHVVENFLTGEDWSRADDEVDMEIGSTKEAVSPLYGFTLGLEAGVVCIDASVKDGRWLERKCSPPDIWGTFGSPPNNRRELEAVRFTV